MRLDRLVGPKRVNGEIRFILSKWDVLSRLSVLGRLSHHLSFSHFSSSYLSIIWWLCTFQASRFFLLYKAFVKKKTIICYEECKVLSLRQPSPVA